MVPWGYIELCFQQTLEAIDQDMLHLCRLLSSSGQKSSLRQPIGSHDANLPESECAGVETAVERPEVADWMELESGRLGLDGDAHN